MSEKSIFGVHHINCCTNMPWVGGLFDGQAPARVISHCLLVESDRGLVLVDTGIGADDMKRPSRLGVMRFVNRPRLDPGETALMQVRKLGFNPDDVKNIIMTHLDLDHAGGLPDFPKARVHVMKPEHEAAMRPKDMKERERYRKAHWAHGPDWVVYDERYDEPWYGFDAIRRLDGLPVGMVYVRLPGHSAGHCGVAVETPGGWLLLAGDTYYYHEQMMDEPRTPFLVHLFQRLAHKDFGQARNTREKLRATLIQNKDRLRVVSSHDRKEFEELSGTRVK
ncbi:MAG: MBL fold metallo-hydrolase [Deltaproteobacteria bacterium]|nr:MBL fold metallo-hydrolase [Deltaproteobacteria bacterium]